jgi:transposase
MSRNDQRTRIIEAAQRIVATQGMDALDPVEVSRVADVAVAAVRKHFPSRRTLFEAAATTPIENFTAHVARAARRLTEADRAERFVICYELHLELFQAMQRISPVLISSLADGGDRGRHLYQERMGAALDALRDAIESAASGWSYQDGDAELISVMSLGTYFWLALLGELGGPLPDTEQMARRFLAFVMRAHEVAPPPVNLPEQTIPPEPPETITDEVWAVLSPHLPADSGRGARWRNHRLVLEAVAWKCRTDLPWRCLPTKFGPWQTAWKRMQRWQADGTWSRLLDAIEQAPAPLRAQCKWMHTLVVPYRSSARV